MIRNLAVLTAVICIFVTSQVRADLRVAVDEFSGPRANLLRANVVTLLERQSGVTVVAPEQIVNAAHGLGVDSLSPAGRMALARELQLSAWITGMVKKHSGELKLSLAVFDGAQHALVGRTSLTARSVSELSDEVRDHLWNKSRRALLGAAAPRDLNGQAAQNGAKALESDASMTGTAVDELRASSSGATATIQSDSADEETHKHGQGRGELLSAFIGLGSPYRSLAFSDPVTPSLGDYELGGAPMVDLSMAIYPARAFTADWTSWLGLEAAAQITASTPAADRDGKQFNTRYDAYRVGLRGRVPVGDRYYVSVFSGYAMNRFAISPVSNGILLPAPSVDYRMIRTGLGAEFAFSQAFALAVDGAWLNLLSVGEIGKWFPHATAGGIELAMFATYNMTQRVFARVSAAYQRTFFDFNPRLGDEKVAGGATDEYFAMSIAAGVIL